jgi:hypothetical protein
MCDDKKGGSSVRPQRVPVAWAGGRGTATSRLLAARVSECAWSGGASLEQGSGRSRAGHEGEGAERSGGGTVLLRKARRQQWRVELRIPQAACVSLLALSPSERAAGCVRIGRVERWALLRSVLPVMSRMTIVARPREAQVSELDGARLIKECVRAVREALDHLSDMRDSVG